MRLWIDDIREMPEDFDVWAKTAEDAIDILKSGKVTHVSFDHDLGDVHVINPGPLVRWKPHEKTGYDVSVWIEQQAFYGKLKPFTYAVHSANPVGAEKISDSMKRAETYWRENGMS